MNNFTIKDGVCTIEIESRAHGKFEVLLNEEDLPRVRMFQWRIHQSGTRFYVRTTFPDTKMHIYMHRLILSFPVGYDVDHINRCTTDNRRENLRPATRSQNNVNSERQSALGVKGVYKVGNRYNSRLRVEGRYLNVGTFNSIEEAVRARELLRKSLSL